jgi:hypothetical protein
MKKSLVIILVAAMAVVCIHFLKSSPEKVATNAGPSTDKAPPAESASLGKPTLHKPEVAKRAEDAAVVAKPEPAAPNQSGDKTIIHTTADFAKGQFDNTALDGGIHLGNDTTPTTFQSKFKLFGLFHSLPEDIPATFDMVTPSYKGTIPEGSALQFSFRTRSPDGNWSTWTEISADSLDKPVMLDAPAMSLQYKLTLFANDSTSSPQITNVTLVTRNTVPKAVPLAQEGNSASSEPNPSN